MGSARSQISMEYIIIIGAILVIIIPLFYYTAQKTNIEISLNRADDAVKSLGAAADSVYSLGPGSKKYVWISIPGNVFETLVNDKEILLRMHIFGGTSDISYRTLGNVTGSLPDKQGTYRVPVEMLDTGIVVIGESNITCGDAVCSPSESCSTCPIDCGSCVCGNDICEATESCITCPSDCGECGEEEEEGVVCGDGICNATENSISCPQDCAVCGNGVCEATENFTTCPADCPEAGVSLTDMGIDTAWYFRTNGAGISTTDSGMADWAVITNDLLDDNINTPSTSYVIRTRGGNKYEGFIPLLNQETGAYTKAVLYGRVRIIDNDPFMLRIYPYNSDGNTPNTAVYRDYQVNASILEQKVKWVELDVSDLIRYEDGFGWLRLRITARNDAVQDNDRFQFSELHYKVG